MKRSDLTYRELLRTIRIHAAEMVAYHGDPAGLMQFRKHFKKYIENVSVFEARLPEFMSAMNQEAFELQLTLCESGLNLDSPIGMSHIELEAFEDCETVL